MAKGETEVCLLSVQESKAWTLYSKPPVRCDENVHQHVTQGAARKMCSAGEARLAYVAVGGV